MKFIFYSVLLCLYAHCTNAQKSEYALSEIPDSLKLNANAVLRLQQTDIKIVSQHELNINNRKVITVLNEKGRESIDAYVNYNKRYHVSGIEATVYDAAGNQIKKIRRSDFRDQIAYDGYTMFSDQRVIYLDYTPTQYPFTLVFEYSVNTSNTAFLPAWSPLADYFVSVEKSILNVTFPNNLGFHKKEFNFAGYPVVRAAESTTSLSYTAAGIIAQKPEYASPDNIYPRVMMAVERFSLEGIDGNAKDWNSFGKWYAEEILSGVTELPEPTKAKIINLVGSEKDPIEKARIVYRFVQEKSRYVSIQLGIGGWKPMLAKDVDRLGYGDCKALTNYTKALLEVVGVPSYHTILYGGRNKRDIEQDIVSVQGNHMTLAIPDGKTYVWLECTSQDAPFGFQANFTDDRNVLVIKPDGTEIARTKSYEDSTNSQWSQGNCTIDTNGNLSGEVNMVSQGAQYAGKYHIKDKSADEKEKYYKEFWNHINNLKIDAAQFANDGKMASFTEKIKISAAGYGTRSGNKMLVAVDVFNQYSPNIKRMRSRKTPFEVSRGFYDSDQVIITLPEGFAVESMPKNVELSNKYGTYKAELTQQDETHLAYKREFLLKKGLYPGSEYEEYRAFTEQVSRNDNAKIILTQKI